MIELNQPVLGYSIFVIFQLPPSETSMGNKQSHSEAEDTVAAAAVSRGKIATSLGAALSSTAVDDSEEPVEVPPPMQPISSVTLSAAVNDSKKVGMGNYGVKRSLHCHPKPEGPRLAPEV